MPNVDCFCLEEDFFSIFAKWNLTIKAVSFLGKHKHVFSHIDWQMRGYEVTVENSNSEFIWVDLLELKEHYAIPTAFKQFLKKAK